MLLPCNVVVRTDAAPSGCRRWSPTRRCAWPQTPTSPRSPPKPASGSSERFPRSDPKGFRIQTPNTHTPGVTDPGSSRGSKPKVVVVGSSFAGLTAALKAKHRLKGRAPGT